MPQTTDKRIMKTQEKLFQAYIQVLQSEDPNDITIQRLTKLAQVNRMTFYNRYQHLANFHEQFMQHYVEQLYSYLKNVNYEAFKEGDELHKLVQLFKHIHKHQDIYRILFTAPTSMPFSQYMIKYFQQKADMKTADIASFSFPGTDVDKEIVVWYGMSALIGTIHMWIQSNFVYSPEVLATSYAKLSTNLREA